MTSPLPSPPTPPIRAREPSTTSAGGGRATEPLDRASGGGLPRLGRDDRRPRSRLTFYDGDWQLLLQRPGWSAEAILSPHDGQSGVLPVLVYKGLVELAGLDS